MGSDAPPAGGGAPASGPSGGGADLSIRCFYYVNVPAMLPFVGKVSDPSELTPGQRVIQRCRDAASGEILFDQEITWPGPGGAPPVDPARLAQFAQTKLTLPAPAPRSWPSLDVPQITGIETWLHVDNFVADTRTASAGGVSATVHADPVVVDWSMGEGGHVTCRGAGAVFVRGASTDCSYVFTTRSTGQGDERFHGEVTITWHLWWDSSIGQGGDLGDVTRTTPIAWTVHELQALIN